MYTTIYGRNCKVRILRDHGAGCADVEVIGGPAGFIGKCYRVSGLVLT